jgi:hypothetical protein
MRPVLGEVPTNALAMVVLPGPSNGGRLSYEIWNFSSNDITAVSIDGFDALGGQGLFFSRVTEARIGTGSSVRVEYPQNGVAGKGPIVLGFSGFGQGQCASVDAEAGTWEDAVFHPHVMDLVGARIQVVFDGGDRGNGEVVLCGTNGRFLRNTSCHSGDAVALISGTRTMQLRLSQ